MAQSDLYSSQCRCLSVTAAIKQDSNRLSERNASPDGSTELMLMLKMVMYKSVCVQNVLYVRLFFYRCYLLFA